VGGWAFAEAAAAIPAVAGPPLAGRARLGAPHRWWPRHVSDRPCRTLSI